MARQWIERGNFGLPEKKKNRWQKIVAPFVLIFWALIFSYLVCYFYVLPYYRLTTLEHYYYGWYVAAQIIRNEPFGEESRFIIWVLLIPTFVVAGTIYLILHNVRSQKVDELQGSAHWATRKEIERAGLIQTGKGAFIGGWRERPPAWQFWKSETDYFLRHDGPEHLLAVAPTRSGKGVSLVIPTLLSWPHSAVVLDVKGENWGLSAGWRNQNVGPTIYFDPSDATGKSARYNPLEEVHLGTPNEVRDVQTIASLLADPDGKGLQDHWAKTSFELLQGAIMYTLCKAKKEGTIYGISDVQQNLIDANHKALCDTWRGEPNFLDPADGQWKVHPLVERVANNLYQKDEREASSIISSTQAYLGLWLDPVVAHNTNKSTFHLNDLVNSDKPVTLYIVVPPSDLSRLRPLLRLMVSQMIYSLTQSMDVKEGGGVKSKNKHRILLLLDEFPTLKKLDLVQSALAYMGGYGAKAYLIVQSYAQLTDIYGQYETISDNCKVHIAFAPNDDATAEKLSKRCGKTTVTHGMTNISGKRFTVTPYTHEQESVNVSQSQRDLLTPDECKTLPAAELDRNGMIVKGGSMLVFVAGNPPILGVQTPYFLDAVFNKRYKIKPPEKSDEFVTYKEDLPVPDKKLVETPDMLAKENIQAPAPEKDFEPIGDPNSLDEIQQNYQHGVEQQMEKERKAAEAAAAAKERQEAEDAKKKAAYVDDMLKNRRSENVAVQHDVPAPTVADDADETAPESDGDASDLL